LNGTTLRQGHLVATITTNTDMFMAMHHKDWHRGGKEVEAGVGVEGATMTTMRKGQMFEFLVRPTWAESCDDKTKERVHDPFASSLYLY